MIETIIDSYRVCKRCAGRILGTKGMDEIDAYLIAIQDLPQTVLDTLVPENNCQLCQGVILQILDKLPVLQDALVKYEFNTFLVGCQLSQSLTKIEEQLERQCSSLTPLKQEIRAEVGKRIQSSLEKEVEFDHPDISIIFTAESARFRLEVVSLYVLGKYQKLIRGIPQTKWPCRSCKGKGCEKCNQTGQQYPESVESLVAEPFLEASHAIGASFHGAGREDIDALMLGTGRPFVLELKKPKIRSLPIRELEKRVNQSSKVHVQDLRFCDKSVISYIKQSSPDSKKTYRALVETQDLLTDEHLAQIKETFPREKMLEQRTPQRVSHRRADLVRKKTIYKVTINHFNAHQMELEITAQGGTYIKEFISGDDGRTIPSISSTIGMTATCIELDVLQVDDHNLFS